MPIRIPNDLPAKKILENENIFVMDESRASSQDIRPLKIGILNLMPIKQDTETQLLRGLSNTPIQVNIHLINTATHTSKNTSAGYLEKFYVTFDEIKNKKYDGMIITGAPVEKMEFEDVNYWEELKRIMDWTKTHVTSTLHICWGAQAGLYYHYGIEKQPLDHKMFGIFEHELINSKYSIVKGFDEVFLAPHSRHTTVNREDIINNESLDILAESKDAGVYLIISKDGRQVFVTGHPEYDLLTIHNEYVRDINKGLDIAVPKNYYPNDDPNKTPLLKWRSHANNLYTNWLNYYVYQRTPFELK